MAVLNPPRALPNLMRAIIEHLLERGPLARDTLGKALVPEPVGDWRQPKGPFDDVMTVGSRMDIFVWADDECTVSAEFSNHLKDHDGSVRRALRDWLLDEDRIGVDPFERVAEDDAKSGSRDLARTLAWFLIQNPLAHPLYWSSAESEYSPETRFRDTFEALGEPVASGTQWNSFDRWAVYLGFARRRTVTSRQASAIIPDPTPVFVDLGPAVWGQERITLRRALEVMGKRIPVLAGGSVYNRMLQRLGVEAEPIPPAIAQSLLYMRDAGQLQLTSEGDAEPFSLQVGDEQRSFTHLRVRDRGEHG